MGTGCCPDANDAPAVNDGTKCCPAEKPYADADGYCHACPDGYSPSINDAAMCCPSSEPYSAGDGLHCYNALTHFAQDECNAWKPGWSYAVMLLWTETLAAERAAGGSLADMLAAAREVCGTDEACHYCMDALIMAAW